MLRDVGFALMAAPLVTVIVPTFDHVETLRYSLPTALTQTHERLEVLVVGDGAPEATREIVEDFAAADPRVSYHWFEKGPRNGEAHRHQLLLDQAQGEYVFYLGDDDLWLPDHVETLLAWMRQSAANFACCQPCWVRPDGEPAHRWVVDLAHEWYRNELLAGRNRVPLNCGAHTMELYRALPHGWRTTPVGTPTDLYMWQQILSHPDCVASSSPYTTVIGVPSSERTGASMEARLQELAAWSPTTDPAVRERFYRAAQAAERSGLLAHAAYEAEYTIALGVIEGLVRHQEPMEREVAELKRLADEHQQIAADLQQSVSERDTHLAAIYNSRGWRALERGRRFRRRITR
jgi:hypothetical protein